MGKAAAAAAAAARARVHASDCIYNLDLDALFSPDIGVPVSASEGLALKEGFSQVHNHQVTVS